MANYTITPAVRLRMDALAELVAEGRSINDAGLTLGLSKGETSNVWRNIKNRMGAQAA